MASFHLHTISFCQSTDLVTYKKQRKKLWRTTKLNRDRHHRPLDGRFEIVLRYFPDRNSRSPTSCSTGTTTTTTMFDSRTVHPTEETSLGRAPRRTRHSAVPRPPRVSLPMVVAVQAVVMKVTGGTGR